MKKNQLLYGLLALIIIVSAYYFLKSDDSEDLSAQIYTTVKEGAFSVSVSATGDLEAKRSKKIMGPPSMRSANIYETTIQRMVPEGTMIKEGDFVAQLDKTEIANKMSDIQSEIDKILTQLEQAKIDTTIEMRSLRDQITNIKFSKEETQLQVELSKFEPEAIIRQKNIAFEKIEREFEQLGMKLSLTKDKNTAKINEIKASLKQQQTKKTRLEDVANEFTIKAPSEGMLIYSRGWRGKVKTGSRVSAWNPIVAELPDLTEMISKTYVNEVDISKVSIGQDCNVSVDAFPDKVYKGSVTQVANIGEQLRDYDTKVFEVLISLNEQDSILRPAMTTGIEILINEFDTVKYIPLEALFKDSVNYVFKKAGSKIIKQEIVTGPSSDLEIMILGGLEKGEEIMMSKPENAADLQYEYFNADKKEELLATLEEENKKRKALLEEKKKNVDKDIERKEEESSVIYFF